MQTAALRLAHESRIQGLPERLSYGPIEIDVTNIERAAAFWTAALGLVPRPSLGGVALGTQWETLLVLHGGASQPALPRHSGLYHFAIGVPTQHEFSRLLARLIGHRIAVTPTDHLMSKAIYLQDPDGLGIEIAYETPERFGRFGDLQRGLELFDAEGNPHSGRAPLDLAKELSHAQGADLDAPIAPGTRIAHVHLSVPNITEAVFFYERLGFVRNLTLPHMGLADLGAGGAYTHRIAVNTWHGQYKPPAPAGSARLRRFSLRIADQRVFEAACQLSDARIGAGGLHFTDPCGINLILVAPE